MKKIYRSYYHKKENEIGEEEVGYTYHLTFVRRLLRMRPEAKIYVRNPDGHWFHKYIGYRPSKTEMYEIKEVLEKIRQREKYKFYMDHIFI